MFFILLTSFLSFHLTLSVKIRKLPRDVWEEEDPEQTMDSRPLREKGHIGLAPIIPDEVKAGLKQYATNYLNSLVTQQSRQQDKQETTEKRIDTPDTLKCCIYWVKEIFKGTRICAEVCQHRCLPSCEWSCCIKENIEEYRTAHLVKPLVTGTAVQRKSHLATANESKKNSSGKKRAHFVKLPGNGDEVIKDGHECNPSCKRYCVPSCRFACCQAVQIKGVLVF